MRILGRLLGGLAAMLALAAAAQEPTPEELQRAAGESLLPPLGLALVDQSSWALQEWLQIPLDGPLAQGLKVPPGRGLSVWTKGLELDISGTEGGANYSGNSRHTLLGMDMLSDNQVMGGALTHAESDVDFKGEGFAAGVHEMSLDGLHLYGGGILDDGAQAWVAVSYETGEVAVKPAAADADERDLDMLTLVAGAKGPYIWQKETSAGITRIISVADGFYSRVSEEGERGDFKSGRLRYGMELTHDYATAGGTALGMAWNLAYRYDIGDFVNNRGFELGLALDLNLAFGLRLEVAARTLTSGDAELDDMTLAASLSWSQAYKNQSQSFALNYKPAGGDLSLAGSFQQPGQRGHPASQALRAPGQLLEFSYERRF